ncbi:MAG: hypothetical protein HOU59_gp75 (endogenous virus) [Lactobacillus phage ViSo-2018a]|uniref:Uncharacterized protein n=1 Tax=Lactobacillus phage ViSo-2018a TaxID=2267607 RepID=A0A3G6JGW5_9CAUD|nr:MAG: hypothetical protein HOU59_gp75 [Lactobacillus phage ViSo-2018a]AZA17315.1 MAG: hypothetical protein DQL93_0680 [Lactobacillus phage ViSo-2018a]
MIKRKKKLFWKTYPEFPWIQANKFGEIRTVDRTVVRSDEKNNLSREKFGDEIAGKVQKMMNN